MQLRDWLTREGMTFSEMGEKIQRSGEAVRRYALGERIPDRETMPKIITETAGEVTANDFFGVSHLIAEANAASGSVRSTGQISDLSGAEGRVV